MYDMNRNEHNWHIHFINDLCIFIYHLIYISTFMKFIENSIILLCIPFDPIYIFFSKILFHIKWRSCWLPVTRRVSHVENDLLTFQGAHEFTLGFSGFRVARTLVIFCSSLFVYLFVCLSVIVCPSMYAFWLPPWYHQTCLNDHWISRWWHLPYAHLLNTNQPTKPKLIHWIHI